MKKYLLFAGLNYYPCGGVRDLIGDYDTIEEAEDVLKAQQDDMKDDDWGFDWWDIVDSSDMMIIKQK